MDGDVKTKEFDESRVLAKAKEVGQIPRIILGRVNGGELASTINITIDATRYVGKFRNEIHRIFENGTPIVLFGDTLLVGFSKSRIMIELKKSQTSVVAQVRR